MGSLPRAAGQPADGVALLEPGRGMILEE